MFTSNFWPSKHSDQPEEMYTDQVTSLDYTFHHVYTKWARRRAHTNFFQPTKATGQNSSKCMCNMGLVYMIICWKC